MITGSIQMMRFYWKRYFVIMLQIAAGSAVIYSSITIYSSIQLRYEQMQAEVHAQTWAVIVYSSTAVDPPLQYDQYLKLKQQYPEALFPLHYVYKAFYPGNNKIEEAYIIYASDDYMQLNVQENVNFEKDKRAYVGSEIGEAMRNNKQLVSPYSSMPKYQIQDDQLILNNNQSYTVHNMDAFEVAPSHIILQGFGSVDNTVVPAEQVVLLPLAAMYEHYQPDDKLTFSLSIRVGGELSGQKATTLIMKVVSQLNEWNGLYHKYSLSTPLQTFLLSIAGVQDTAIICLVIAVICLVLVIIGLTGLVHLMFTRRKQGMAILMAMGVKRGRLFRGMMLEFILPALIDAVLGVTLSALYLPRFVRFQYVDIHQSMEIAVFTTICCVVPVILSVSTLVLRIYRIQPIEILRREQGYR